MRLWAALAAAAGLSAQAAPAPRHPDPTPRTAFGQPDLQGYWTNVALTPLERPPGVPLSFPTRAEGDAYETRQMALAAGRDDALGQSASEWTPIHPMGRIDGQVRTSWIVSPADGRVPYRPGARERYNALGQAANTLADGPEQRTPSDRCLAGGGATTGPPMLNHHSGSSYQIVQTPDAVAIRMEMNHDVRIVRLHAQHLPPAMRPWMGDSIGWWEGPTLVVETTNFHPQEGNRLKYLMSSDARVTERFTRVSATELRYEFQIDDPATFTGPWRGEMPLHPEKSPIWEYACHEGNYSMAGILGAARKAEADARAGGH